MRVRQAANVKSPPRANVGLGQCVSPQPALQNWAHPKGRALFLFAQKLLRATPRATQPSYP